MGIKRQYGIDLLRIYSMFMILILHVLLQGGVLGNITPLSNQFKAAWLLEALSICAVNCYALISGYVSVNTTKLKVHKIAALWLQVAFYTVLITVVFVACGYGELTDDVVRKSIFPVYTYHYWYFSCYFILFFFIPYLNKMLNALNEKELKTLFFIIVFLISLLTTVFRTDAFKLSKGYSFVWLMMLYLLGGLTKKLHKYKLKVFPLLLGYFASGTIAFLFYYFVTKSGTKEVSPKLFMEYTSITILMCAYFLFLAAINMDIKFKPAIELIKFLSPLSFSVYIIHTNEWIWKFFMKDRFAEYAQLRTIKLVIAVISAAAALYLICSAIDLIRYHLFRILKVSSLLEKLENKIFNNKTENEVSLTETASHK